MSGTIKDNVLLYLLLYFNLFLMSDKKNIPSEI